MVFLSKQLLLEMGDILSIFRTEKLQIAIAIIADYEEQSCSLKVRINKAYIESIFLDIFKMTADNKDNSPDKA